VVHGVLAVRCDILTPGVNEDRDTAATALVEMIAKIYLTFTVLTCVQELISSRFQIKRLVQLSSQTYVIHSLRTVLGSRPIHHRATRVKKRRRNPEIKLHQYIIP